MTPMGLAGLRRKPPRQPLPYAPAPATAPGRSADAASAAAVEPARTLAYESVRESVAEAIGHFEPFRLDGVLLGQDVA